MTMQKITRIDPSGTKEKSFIVRKRTRMLLKSNDDSQESHFFASTVEPRS